MKTSLKYLKSRTSYPHFSIEEKKPAMTNPEMKQKSGEFKSDDPVVALLYTLARDLIPVGKLQEVIDVVANDNPDAVFTNGWLAKWAEFAASQIAVNIDHNEWNICQHSGCDERRAGIWQIPYICQIHRT